MNLALEIVAVGLEPYLSDFIDQGKYLLLVFWDYGLFGQYLFVLSNRALCRIHIILLLRTHWLLWLSPLEFKR